MVRGRSLRRPSPADGGPDFGLLLSARTPGLLPWPTRWLRWPDFGLPTNRVDAQDALFEVWARIDTERVEISCGGGRGRTGTALACLAVLDGLPPDEAVSYVRQHYRPGAAEMPWQRRYVRHFLQL